MTSSEVLPAGISCAVTFWSECSAFHSFTMALPQAISSGLLESHTLMGPVEDLASLESEPLPQAAVSPRARTAAEAVRRLRFIVAPFRGAYWVGCGAGRGAHDEAGVR